MEGTDFDLFYVHLNGDYPGRGGIPAHLQLRPSGPVSDVFRDGEHGGEIHVLYRPAPLRYTDFCLYGLLAGHCGYDPRVLPGHCRPGRAEGYRRCPAAGPTDGDAHHHRDRAPVCDGVFAGCGEPTVLQLHHGFLRPAGHRVYPVFLLIEPEKFTKRRCCRR